MTLCAALEQDSVLRHIREFMQAGSYPPNVLFFGWARLVVFWITDVPVLHSGVAWRRARDVFSD